MSCRVLIIPLKNLQHHLPIPLQRRPLLQTSGSTIDRGGVFELGNIGIENDGGGEVSFPALKSIQRSKLPTKTTSGKALARIGKAFVRPVWTVTNHE